MRVWRWCLLLMWSATIALAQESARTNAPANLPGGRLLDRIVVIGASASAGFTASEPLGGPGTRHYALDRYLDAALIIPHERVRTLASTYLFLHPDADAQRQVRAAIAAEPTLVVGVDFLFWFCYGDATGDVERMEWLENGLKLLETIPCPIVIGDIPDASGAENWMLDRNQIPRRTVLVAANRRLREWAATRKQVIVAPLAEFMRAAAANQPIKIRGRAVTLDGPLLQADHLHPTETGCSVVALAVLDAVISSRSSVNPAGVRWDPAEIARIVLAALPMTNRAPQSAAPR